MTQLNEIKITLPKLMHAAPHKSGMLDHFPTAGELKKVCAIFDKSVTDEERKRYQSDVAALLKRMVGVYHPSLPDLVSVCAVYAKSMSDANLDRALAVCEGAFHGYRANTEKPDYGVLLTIAAHALVFINLLLRRKLGRYEDAFTDLHGRFFHFAHCAMACLQPLAGAAPGRLVEQISGDITAFLLLGRMDLFSMTVATQKELIRTLSPILSKCEVHFIPAGEEIDKVDGFWIARENKRVTGRATLHNSLAGASANDRLVAAIAPLIRVLEEANRKPDGTVQVQAVLSSEMNRLIRKKLGTVKHSDERGSVREDVRLLFRWDEVVDLPTDKGVTAILLDVDESGFRLIVDGRDVELPGVDSLFAVNRSGHGVKRATLLWKRLQTNGVMLGGVWLAGEFEQVQLSMLGHSEMSVGVREWHALLRQRDDKHVACWIGEHDLQPGISVLLPIGGKKYSSSLDQVEHRGGNYCQGVLLIGKEWKEVNFELDL